MMRIAALLLAAASLLPSAAAAAPAGDGAAAPARVETLANGLQLLVIEDNRAPIVTHMVWYRVGRADEPPGRSGLAHLVEHLMFKATAKHAAGELQRAVGRLGGADNALTGQDTTVYYQRIAREHLATVMRFEADRMRNLRPTGPDLAAEREIVLAERRQRIDQSPLDILNEEMAAALFRNHPYATPVLGWPEEIAALTLDDAMEFYHRHYHPANALVVVAGDVERRAVLQMAEATYGAVPPGVPSARQRPSEPEQRAARRVVLADRRIASPSVTRMYLVPSAVGATGPEAETLEVLARLMCQGDMSRAYQRLVSQDRIAIAVDGGYQSRQRDHGQVACHVAAGPRADAAAIEAALDGVLDAVRRDGFSDDEVAVARRVIETSHLFEMDRQFNRANRYGALVAVGQSAAAVDGYLERLRRVTPADVAAMARRVLDPRLAVTGWLVPENEMSAKDKEPRQ
jgi:zinc protease